MALPFFSQSEIVATLHVHSKRVSAFGPREQVILERLAVQIAPAIANALSMEALRQTEARSRALLETTSDAIITVDEDGLIQSFNRSAEQMFGYSAIELIGRKFRILMGGPDDGAYGEEISLYGGNGKPKFVDSAGRILHGRHRDGRPIPQENWVGAV